MDGVTILHVREITTWTDTTAAIFVICMLLCLLTMVLALCCCAFYEEGWGVGCLCVGLVLFAIAPPVFHTPVFVVVFV